MSVSINEVVIDSEFIEAFKKNVHGVVLRVEAPVRVGRAIYNELKDYKEGDLVKIKDFHEFKHSGFFVIEEIGSIVEGSDSLQFALAFVRAKEAGRNPRAPRFGVWSLAGGAVKRWAQGIYERIVEVKREKVYVKQEAIPSIRVEEDPLRILKVRYAKGEITKEEYEEMKKTLEL